MSVQIEIRGLSELMKTLDQMEPRNAKKLIGKATADAAKKVLKPALKAAAPKGPTGNLKRSVSAGSARRDKPAGIAKFRHRVAPHRHLVMLGTGTRKTKRSGANRGVMPANPIVSRVADEKGDEALRHVEAELVRALGLD